MKRVLIFPAICHNIVWREILSCGLSFILRKQLLMKRLTATKFPSLKIRGCVCEQPGKWKWNEKNLKGERNALIETQKP